MEEWIRISDYCSKCQVERRYPAVAGPYGPHAAGNRPLAAPVEAVLGCVPVKEICNRCFVCLKIGCSW